MCRAKLQQTSLVQPSRGAAQVPIDQTHPGAAQAQCVDTSGCSKGLFCVENPIGAAQGPPRTADTAV